MLTKIYIYFCIKSSSAIYIVFFILKRNFKCFFEAKLHLHINLQECSVFVFDKKTADKLHKPRRREMVSEVLRRDIRHLERIKHPHILSVIHGLEECQ